MHGNRETTRDQTSMPAPISSPAQISLGFVRQPLLIATALMLAFASPTYSQRAGNGFDPNFQKRALREYAGPTASCEPTRFLPGFVCSERFPEYGVSIQGTAETMVAAWTPLRPGGGADQVIPRLIKFAGHFGFGRDETVACTEKAVLRAQNTVGHEEEKLANADYQMVCRGWKSEAIELVITLVPKRSF